MDWQQLFLPHILSRGFDIYQHKLELIDAFEETEESAKAIVYGTEAYDVQIIRENNEIIEMDCDCPYAEQGNNCKHMAAILFLVDEQANQSEAKLITTNQSLQENENELEKLINEADEHVVRHFLLTVLKNDVRLYGQFRQALHCETNAEDMERYKNEIDSIFYEYTDGDEYIDYYRADSFINELETFLEEDIQRMLVDGQYEAALDLTNYLFIEVGNQDMDDSAGGIWMIAEDCLEIWQQILERCDLILKRKMFEWCLNHLNGSEIDYREDYIEQILFADFSEEEFLEKKLKFAESKILKHRKHSDSWTREYYTDKWLMYSIEVMERMGLSDNEITDFCKANLEFSSVRKFYVKKCIQKKEYETAIHLLKEGKEADHGSDGLVADYSMQLAELYKKIGHQKEYKNELWLLMLEYEAGSLEIYRELKTLYLEEEWPEKRESIFKELSSRVELGQLYKEDQLYDRLLKLVLNSNGIYKLTEYEKCLKSLYPEQLLMKYESVVQNMSKNTANRKHYQELVRILRRMKKYSLGEKVVNEIVNDWKSTYKNRPAMMDELNKL